MSVAEARHTLLFAMAADAEKLRAQAERIKELRKCKELRDGVTISQETAAYAIGVSSRTYRTWEGTGADLKVENMRSLAEYYGSTVDYIAHGMREPSATPDLSKSESQLDRIEAVLGDIQERLKRIEARPSADTVAIQRALEDYMGRLGREIGKRPPRSRRATDPRPEARPTAA